MFRLKCYSLMLKAPLDADHRSNKIWQKTYGEKHDGWHIWTFHLQAGIKGKGRVFLKESGLTLGVPLSQGCDCIWRPAVSLSVYFLIYFVDLVQQLHMALFNYGNWGKCTLWSVIFMASHIFRQAQTFSINEADICDFLVEWFIKDTDVRRTMLLKINRTTMSCKLKNVYMIVFLF